ncbi:glycine betaine ABC transporter substrate-binding protein [Sinorhizobium meliloti]|uniref:glycine betaine ABC transporter substrate-binding protein n=1 Tax=Rhizobium meliloti TaxID=382 RepID=UPI001F282910|nr:glycine betaine ABC transporter substrate-binding protein [Sinorhizobium meliloti]
MVFSLSGRAAPALSDFATGGVVTAVTSSFKEREPEIAELMSKVSFTNEQMNSLLAWREENNASPDETAAHFLSTYKDVWPTWLNDKARGKLAALAE